MPGLQRLCVVRYLWRGQWGRWTGWSNWHFRVLEKLVKLNSCGVMRKTQGLTEVVIGLLGTITILSIGNYWSYLPLIVYGVLSTALIRRIAVEQPSKEEALCVRKRNLVTLICWALAAAICYFTFKGARIGENGEWFVLSTYVFLLMHGIAFLAPIKSFPNEK